MSAAASVPSGCAAVRPRAAEAVSNAVVNGEHRHPVVACSEPHAIAAAGQFHQLLCPAPLGEALCLRG